MLVFSLQEKTCEAGNDLTLQLPMLSRINLFIKQICIRESRSLIRARNISRPNSYELLIGQFIELTTEEARPYKYVSYCTINQLLFFCLTESIILHKLCLRVLSYLQSGTLLKFLNQSCCRPQKTFSLFFVILLRVVLRC